MRLWPIIVVALVIAGCGADDPASAGDERPGATATSATSEAVGSRPAAADATSTAGTTIVLRNSRFGSMLFDARRQAIYVFENDRRNRSVCYGACARAWPPVLTRGRPRARGGARPALLGTARRRDGKLQVTYAGRPLYYYAHERPGEVLCHNVDLNGGLWWVIGPNGKRRP